MLAPARSLNRRVLLRVRPARLTPQQQKFVDFLLGGLQPGEAAEQAGYGMAGAKTYNRDKAASVLLAKSHVAKAIRDGRTKQREQRAACRPELSRSEIVADLDDIARMANEAGSGAWQAQCLLKVAELKAKLMGLFQQSPGDTDGLADKLAEARRNVAINVNFVAVQNKSAAALPAEPQPIAASAGRLLASSPSSQGVDVPCHRPVAPEGECLPPPPRCEKHGPYQPQQVNLPGTKRYVPGFCPQCVRDGAQDDNHLRSLLPNVGARDRMKPGWNSGGSCRQGT